jgi:hypothetical protein
MSSRTTHSKLKLQKTSKTARSEFGKSNAVTAKKSTDADKNTDLDAEANVTGATLKKAPPPDVTNSANSTVKDTMMEATVMGDATLEKATVPGVTAANKNTIGKKEVAEETAVVPHPNMAHVKRNPMKVAVEITTTATMTSK